MGTDVAGKRVGGRARVIFGVVSAAVFSAVVLAGCGGDDNSFGPNAKGGNVVLGDGEAWIRTNKECIGGECYDVGWIFKENGDLINITDNGGNWLGERIGIWSTDGNQMTITYSAAYDGTGNSGTCNYDVSGNTLTVYDRNGTVTFTKKSDVSSIVGKGGNVVLADGEAWISTKQDCGNFEGNVVCFDWGWIFKENGDFIQVIYNDGTLQGLPAGWSSLNLGTWFTAGAKMTITYSDAVLAINETLRSGTGVYSVEGNTFTLYSGNGTATFTKVSGLSSVTMMGKKREGVKILDKVFVN